MIKKTFIILLYLSAAGLLLIIMAGQFNMVKLVDDHGSPGARAIAGYHYPVRDTSRLEALLHAPVANYDFRAVNDLIFESLVHDDDRKIQPTENWLLWLTGHLFAPLARTQSAARIVAGGAGLCSEMGEVFNRIAAINGYETRFIGLNGHVVTEINSAEGWRVVDPDYGVSYPVGIDILQTEQAVPLIRQALAARGFDDTAIKNYIRVMQSTNDNTTLDIGSALSPRLYLLEEVAEWLKWLLPILMLIIALLLQNHPDTYTRKKPVQ